MLRLSFLGFCLFFAVSATATERSSEELAVARELFESAQEAQQREDWASCERRVAEAAAIIETPGLRFHLAYCKERQGRWVAALVDYKRALELVRGGVRADDVSELLGPAIARMEADTPRLTLTLEKIPPDTTLYLDGRERSPRLLGKAIPVDPGGVRLNVSAPGYEPFEQHINLLSGERRTLAIVLAEKPAPLKVVERDGARVPASGGGGAKTWVLLAEGAMTLGGLALGVVESVERAHATDDREAIASGVGVTGCNSAGVASDPRCSRLLQLGKDLKRAEALELTGYIVAGAGFASFVATWLLWDNDSNATSAAQRFTLIPTSAGAMGLWSGKF